jgi:cytochrome c oxidase cbb3-type subunit 4
MSPLWGVLAGTIIVILMLTFIGIWIWAWRKRHQRVFDQMAQLPLQEDMDDRHTDTHTVTQEDRP